MIVLVEHSFNHFRRLRPSRRLPLASSSVIPTHKRTFASSHPTMSGKKIPQIQHVKGILPEIINDASTYAHELTLPKLPVPTLEETCQRYIKSIKPLLDESTFQKSKKTIEQFQSSEIAQKLQSRLQKRGKEFQTSWLIDWWNEVGYFGYRDPVVVYVSYFFQFKDDRFRPRQCTRAASIIEAAMEFRHLLKNQSLTPDKTAKNPLSMAQYQFLFNSCRIPNIPSDYGQIYDINDNDFTTVVRKNQFFRLDLTENGQPLTAAEIELQLQKIIEMAGAERHPSVGALTSDNRDVWTKAREALIEAHPKNKELLEQIQSSAFVMCLDDTSPVTREEVGVTCWVGDGQNRFYDKSVQFIVCENGKAGHLGEHSLMDGIAVSRMCEYVCGKTLTQKATAPDSIPNRNLSAPVKLEFHLNSKVTSAISASEAQFESHVAKHELAVLAFDGYGKNIIKTFKQSPDAFVQMAIQLAYYKMFGKSCPTYESAQTRKYLYGRTETCRTMSLDSVEFVKAMENPDVPAETKAELCRRATSAHGKYLGDAVEGKGVDRHLLGLRLSLASDEAKPDIFTDPIYARSCHWNLSTSQITSEFYDGYGWSEVVPDGFGIAYMIKDKTLHFNIVSMKMGSNRMKHFLQESLTDLREMFEQAQGQNASKAKL